MNEQLIYKDIERQFRFLLDRGFRIQSIKYYPQHMGNWIAVLASQDCLIKLTNDRGELLLSLGPNYEQEQVWFDINTWVFYISKGQILLDQYKESLKDQDKQFQRLADILAKYLDEILAIMAKDFEKHKANLLETRKVVRDLYLEKHKASKKSH